MLIYVNNTKKKKKNENDIKVKFALHGFLCEFKSSMSLLQTGHEHLGYLGSFHNVIFCSKLTRVPLFFIFAGSCCHDYSPLYTIISSPQYTAFGNRLLRSLGFLMVYGIFLSLNVSFIIGGDRHFRYLKILIISCWFEYFLFIV